MTSSCSLNVLIYFCGVPLVAAWATRAIYGVTNQLAPSFLDETPSILRVAAIIAAVLTAAWLLQCHLGIPLSRGSGCVCD